VRAEGEKDYVYREELKKMREINEEKTRDTLYQDGIVYRKFKL
jgi:hypothetical protein